MRRTIIYILFLMVTLQGWGQFSTSPVAYQPTEHEGVDAIFIFNGINGATTITYTGSDFAEWQQWDGSFQSNQTNFSPDEGGYKLKKTDGTFLYIWVFDYENYAITIDGINPITDAEDKCTALSIDVVLSDLTKELIYYTSSGDEKQIKREFLLSYDDISWNGDSWIGSKKQQMVSYPFTSIVLEQAPLRNTQFTLVDNLSRSVGTTVELTSSEIQAIAVEAHPKGEVVERDSETEIDQSSTSSTVSNESRNCKCKQLEEYAKQSEATHDPIIGGSAPLVVEFKSNGNKDATNFVEWYIYNYGSPSTAIRYIDTDFRFTFASAGEYTVKMVATGSACECTDSINIIVFDSYIDLPNIFTPNDDGVNDEFRAVYRSITTFKGWIYNRWGRLVYSWEDPAEGWNGKINGKKAAPGAYYYVIQAVGADTDKKGKPLQWKCSGDINLLRGK